MLNAENLNGEFLSATQLKNIKFKSLGKNVDISSRAVIVGCQNISIGNNVRIDPFTTIVASEGKLEISDYVHIAGGCHLTCIGGIKMNEFTVLAHGVKLYSGSDAYDGSGLTHPMVDKQLRNLKIGRINLGKHVIIGANSVVLPGVTIGDGAAVGAQSLVKSNLEGWQIFAGIPVKKLRSRSKLLLHLERGACGQTEL